MPKVVLSEHHIEDTVLSSCLGEVEDLPRAFAWVVHRGQVCKLVSGVGAYPTWFLGWASPEGECQSLFLCF